MHTDTSSRFVDIVPFTWRRDDRGRIRHSGWNVRCPRTHPQAEDAFVLHHHVIRCKHKPPPGDAGICGALLYVLYDRDRSRLIVAEMRDLDEIRELQFLHLSARQILAHLGIEDA